jgi:tRNA(adenine34) deaminase
MNPNATTDEYFMRLALAEAKAAFDQDEIPVGAVVVCKGQVIARAHNMTERLNDVTAHAEMIAYTSASNHLNSKYLDECTLYVTLEPCVMCAGAAYWTQIGRIVYGAADPKRGFTTVSGRLIHPKSELINGVLRDECAALLVEFFKNKRD